MYTCVDSVHVAVRGQLEGAGSLFMPRGTWEPNSGCWFDSKCLFFWIHLFGSQVEIFNSVFPTEQHSFVWSENVCVVRLLHSTLGF